ncbi:hypothetical protein D3C87_1271000 [compost metagenome]
MNSLIDFTSTNLILVLPIVAFNFLGISVTLILNSVCLFFTNPSKSPVVRFTVTESLSCSPKRDSINVEAPFPDLYPSEIPSSSYSVNELFPFG